MAINEATKTLRKHLAKSLRPAAKKIRKDARSFHGSKLRSRSGKTAKTVRVTVPSGSRKGVYVRVTGAAAINIWEYGRKAYVIKVPKGQALKMPWGWVAKRRIRIKAEAPRPVLTPAIERHKSELLEAGATALQSAAVDILCHGRVTRHERDISRQFGFTGGTGTVSSSENE